MSSTYDFAVAVLTETEKNRMLCCYLNMTDPVGIEWDKATKDYGSASVESFRKGVQNSMKKVKAAEATGVVTEGGAKTTAKAKGTPKKRKGTDDEEAAEESPKSKKGKKGKKGKKEVTPEEGAEDAATVVKSEEQE